MQMLPLPSRPWVSPYCSLVAKCCILPALLPLMNPQIVTFSCHTAENSMQSKARCQWGLVSTKTCICSAPGWASWVGCIYFSFGARPLSRGDFGASSLLTKWGMSRVILQLTFLLCDMALFPKAEAVSAWSTVSLACSQTVLQQRIFTCTRDSILTFQNVSGYHCCLQCLLQAMQV